MAKSEKKQGVKAFDVRAEWMGSEIKFAVKAKGISEAFAQAKVIADRTFIGRITARIQVSDATTGSLYDLGEWQPKKVK